MTGVHSGDANASDESSAAAPAVAKPRNRRRRNRIVGIILGVVVLWAVASILTVVEADKHVHDGANEITQVHQSLSADQLLSGAPVLPLESAESNFASANSLLSSPLLWPVDVLPVLGRQLRSVQDLSRAAGQVSKTGVSVVHQSRELLNLPHTAGPERIAALQRLALLASTTHATLSQVDLGPSQALLGPLASQRAKFASELSQVQTTLSRTSAGATAAAAILTGPQNYLLLAGNNAEMRSGSGMFLEAGNVAISDGEMHLQGMQPTWSLILPQGAVPVGGDLEARWGFFLPGVDYRNLGLTPQFDVNGELASRMWKASTGQQVDGVMALDITGLQELLKVTGPVTTAGGTVVTAATVDQLLLHDQYVGAGNTTGAFEENRVDDLGSMASAMMHALQTQPLDLHVLADALSTAAEGRHLMLWSADPATEAVWRSIGVSGQLTGDTLASNVINRGGNKLDQYLSVSNSLHLVSHADSTSATLTVNLANRTPPGQVEYIAGPNPDLDTHYGEYVGIVNVNLPGDTRDLSIGPGESAVTSGPEGPTLLVGVSVDLLPGASRQVTFHFTLPGAHGTMTVMPSARIPPETWTLNGETFDDAAPRNISW